MIEGIEQNFAAGVCRLLLDTSKYIMELGSEEADIRPLGAGTAKSGRGSDLVAPSRPTRRGGRPSSITIYSSLLQKLAVRGKECHAR